MALSEEEKAFSLRSEPTGRGHSPRGKVDLYPNRPGRKAAPSRAQVPGRVAAQWGDPVGAGVFLWV